MILSRKGRPGEIAEIERLHLGRACVSVLQRFLSGFYRERTEIAIRERAKRSLPDAGDSYWSHTFRITPAPRLQNRAREQAARKPQFSSALRKPQQKSHAPPL